MATLCGLLKTTTHTYTHTESHTCARFLIIPDENTTYDFGIKGGRNCLRKENI